MKAFARRFLQHARANVLIQRDDLAERVERRGDASPRLLGHEHHAVIAAAVGERDAETVENAPARRRQQPS